MVNRRKPLGSITVGITISRWNTQVVYGTVLLRRRLAKVGPWVQIPVPSRVI